MFCECFLGLFWVGRTENQEMSTGVFPGFLWGIGIF